MAHKEWIQKQPATCPAPMTRAALVALRDAGTLSTGCHYTITDHVQGRLVAGTTVTLHAAAPNELGDTAFVNTTYDNTAWAGRYDIDTGLVFELGDNRNNRVVGSAAVGAFDWGNTAYTGCLVEHATWTVTYGNATPMQNVRVLDGSTLTTTGISGTGLSAVEVNKQSTLNLSSSTLAVATSLVTNAATVNASGFAGAGPGIRRSSIDASTLTIGAAAGAVDILQTRIAQSAVSHTGAGAFTVARSNIENDSLVAHSSAGAITLTGTIVSFATINHTSAPGSLTITGSEVRDSATINRTDSGGTGAATITRSLLGSRCVFVANGAGNITLNESVVTSGGVVRSEIGSAATLNVLNSTVEGASLVDVTAAAGVADLRYVSLTGGGSAVKSGDGNLTMFRVSVVNLASVLLSGARGLTITATSVSNEGRVLASSAAAGATDTIGRSEVTTRATVSFAATGALANNLTGSRVSGTTGQIAFSGANSGSTLNRSVAENGTITISDNTVAMPGLADISARDSGDVVISNNRAAQTVTSVSVTANGTVTVTGKSAGAVHQDIVASAGGSITSRGAARNLIRATVTHGVVDHNGGVLTDVSKTMGGTLTTGAFTHSNIQHHVNANKTLTAANSNRADYQGLAAQLV